MQQDNNTMTPEREREFADVAQHVLEELDIQGIASESSGLYFIYMDYYEELSDDLIGKILTSNNPRNTLSSIITEIEDSHIGYHIDSIAAEMSGIITAIGTFTDEEYGHILNKAMDKVVFALDHEFFQQDVRLNIIADIDDAACDFSSVIVGPHYLADELTSLAEYHDTAWYWLARQQGYDDAQILAALSNAEFGGSRFLESLYREIMDSTSAMGKLTFLVRTTLDTAIQLTEAVNEAWSKGVEHNGYSRVSTGTVSIPKHTTVGFIDDWNGSGGTLGIHLERRLELPIRYIFSALPDGEDGVHSVKDIYGIGPDYWDALIDVRLNYKQA